jgi:CRISPR type III-B/RAMP module-associated protein Cmr5
MAINNLEQKRLLYARRQANRADKRSSNYDSMIKKVPAYIQKNGFVYTMAFLNEKDKAVFEDIWKWHCSSDLNGQQLMPNTSQGDFLNRLLETDDMNLLRGFTLETLAIMKCFRRFVKDED